MSTRQGVLHNPINGQPEQVYSGFSWPCFFLGCFWYVYKGMGWWALIALVAAFCTMGFSWLVFPFLANSQHRDSLLKRGYLSPEAWAAQQNRNNVASAPHVVVAAKTSTADELQKLRELVKSGALTEDEYALQKAKVLAA